MWLIVSFFRVKHGCQLREFDKKATMPLRGLMALLVVSGHLVGHGIFTIEAMRAISWARPAVGTFFFLSGYGMTKSLGGGGKYLRHLIPRTCVKLFVPLACIMAIKGLYMVAIGTFDVRSLFETYLNGKTPLCEHSWYVFELFFFCICFYLAGMFVNDGRLFAGFLFVSTIVLHVVLRYAFKWPSWWWVHAFAFPVGSMFARHEMVVLDRIKRHGSVIFLVGLCAWTMLVGLRFLWGGYGSEVVFSGLIGVFVAICSYCTPLPQTRFMMLLGAVSYEIYLTHGEVRIVLAKRLLGLNIDTNLCATIILIASIVVGFAFDSLRRKVKLV